MEEKQIFKYGTNYGKINLIVFCRNNKRGANQIFYLFDKIKINK